ncbi:MAG: hypothetical protein FWE57_04335 [Chitinispirillia bacterium]|nr:hypothetical protein [Chitinispirillia bacterium]
MGKFLELMRTGTFVDRHRNTYTITKEHLNKLVQNFNQQNPKNRPHLLVGHRDRPNVPSFGVVDALKVAGDKLLFRAGEVVAEFEALVKKGGFPGVSAGLTQTLDKLDHIAFLSAQKPAIDGLKPIAEFSAPEGGEELVEAESSEFSEADLAEFGVSEDLAMRKSRIMGDILRSLKNFLIERYGVDVASGIISEWQLEVFDEEPPTQEDQAQFSSNSDNKQEPAAASDTKLDEALSQNKALIAQVAELAKTNRLAEFTALVETAVQEGKVLPDQKQAAIDRMEALHDSSMKINPAKLAEFSAIGVSDHNATVEIYKKHFEALPRIAPEPGEIKYPEFAAAKPDVLATGSEIGKQARAYMAEMKAKGVAVDAVTAVKHVEKNFNLI